MESNDGIVNRVAKSSLISIDLEDYWDKTGYILYDIKDNLFEGLILREKDFREFIKSHAWDQYKGKHVGIYCSSDAIIPVWAYMLLMSKLTPIADMVIIGGKEALERAIIDRAMSKIDFTQFQDAKVVIKGCSDLINPAYFFTEFTKKIMPFAGSIMYGEPCSTVPIYKKPKGN